MRTSIILLAPLIAGLACASTGRKRRADDGGAQPRTEVGEAAPARVALRELPTPAHIPLEVRARIAEKMELHGAAMRDIWDAVVLLDFAAASDAAFAIERRPALAQPVSRDDAELARHLPPAFFDLQDELAENARAFAMASVTEDPNVVAAKLADLSNTCISCHSVYLADPDAR